MSGITLCRCLYQHLFSSACKVATCQIRCHFFSIFIEPSRITSKKLPWRELHFLCVCDFVLSTVILNHLWCLRLHALSSLSSICHPKRLFSSHHTSTILQWTCYLSLYPLSALFIYQVTTPTISLYTKWLPLCLSVSVCLSVYLSHSLFLSLSFSLSTYAHEV